MRHLLLFAVIALLPVAVFAQTSPGCIAGSVPGMHNCRDGSYTHVDLVSNQTNTGPNEVRFSGPITPGDVVGFDYSFIHDGAPQVRRFRHAMKAGDTHRTVLDDLAAQWRADPVVNAAIGADIVSYALVRQAGPESWVFQFYENWPFVDKANPRLEIALSPGATVRGEGSAGNKTLESNPYWSCGRTTIEQGRSPQKGDRLCSFYVTGDVIGRPLDNRNVDQTYAQWEYTVIDPTPGVATARFTLNVDTVDLDVKHLLIGGKPAGPIGMPGPPGAQGPPGGNVAGSIVQSPALAVCADRAQTGANCVDTRVYKFAGLGIAGWKTIATVIPSTVAGVQSMSKVKVEAVVNTRALGQGTLEAQAYVSIADGPPTVRRIGRDNIAGRPPRLQLVAGPNNSLLIQMASTDGLNPIVSGFAKIEYMLADAEGVPLTWRIE